MSDRGSTVTSLYEARRLTIVTRRLILPAFVFLVASSSHAYTFRYLQQWLGSIPGTAGSLFGSSGSCPVSPALKPIPSGPDSKDASDDNFSNQNASTVSIGGTFQYS